MFVEFFGRPASTHKAIALLAIEHRRPGRRRLRPRGSGRGSATRSAATTIIEPDEWTGTADDARLLTQRYTTALETDHPPRPRAVPLAAPPLEAPAEAEEEPQRRPQGRRTRRFAEPALRCLIRERILRRRRLRSTGHLLLEHLDHRHDLDLHVLEREGGDLPCPRRGRPRGSPGCRR